VKGVNIWFGQDNQLENAWNNSDPLYPSWNISTTCSNRLTQFKDHFKPGSYTRCNSMVGERASLTTPAEISPLMFKLNNGMSVSWVFVMIQLIYFT
jgi:hypothetical protein